MAISEYFYCEVTNDVVKTIVNIYEPGFAMSYVSEAAADRQS